MPLRRRAGLKSPNAVFQYVLDLECELLEYDLFLFIYQSKEEYKENAARLFTIKARNARKYTYVLQTEFDKMRFLDTGIVL